LIKAGCDNSSIRISNFVAINRADSSVDRIGWIVKRAFPYVPSRRLNCIEHSAPRTTCRVA
ncbi:hypothetical protein K1T71_011064, partial [Dendrolimus kikuchii]